MNRFGLRNDNQSMNQNPIKTKSYDFALQIVDLFKLLTAKKEFILSKQILRSGTSIGANVFEAQGGISKREFIVKIQIAYKECLETIYWLNLLKDSKFIDEKSFNEFSIKCEELRKILVSIQKTSKGE
ncbi:MAG: four helix bundle protein [Candidatus Dojkabacteria bacterium]